MLLRPSRADEANTGFRRWSGVEALRSSPSRTRCNFQLLFGMLMHNADSQESDHVRNSKQEDTYRA